MTTSNDTIATLELIGRKIAAQRKVAGLTQQELAAASKVSRATIAAIEKGSADPKLSTIISICAGISPNAWSELAQGLWAEQVADQMSQLAQVPDQDPAVATDLTATATAVGATASALSGAACVTGVPFLGGIGGVAIIGGVFGAIKNALDERDRK